MSGKQDQVARPVAEYHDREAWLKERQSGIGGSEAGAICGVDPHQTALTVYQNKVSPVVDAPPTPDQLRGQVYEAIAAQLYGEQTGRKLRRAPLRRHKRHPWMLVSMDRQQVGAGSPSYVEIKCPRPATLAQIRAKGLPERYILQLQHGLEVTGYERGVFVVYDCVLVRVIHFDVERDPKIGEFLVEKEGEFWHRHVLAGLPPTESPVVLPDLPEVKGEIVQRDDPEWARAVATFIEARDLADTAAMLDAAARDQLKGLMGGFGIAEGASLRAYYRQMPGRRTLDRKALEASRPVDALALAAKLNGLLPLAMITEAIEQSRLDLRAYEKVGLPYPEFRPFLLRASNEDAD